MLVPMEQNDLNQEQQRAVDHNEGPMLVVAGAGTGKTSVITRRIARLVTEQRANPEEILALTFTDKAAGEMLDRLDALIGWQAYRVNVLTFHAFGQQVLQRYGHHMGRATRAEIVPELAKLVLLQQNLPRVQLSYYGAQDDIWDFLSTMMGYIGALQNADIGLEEFRDFVNGLVPDSEWHALDIADMRDKVLIYDLYETIKRENGLIDYDDQVRLPLQLLQQKPNIAAKLAAQFSYVLVDEYQDTNSVQDALLRAIVPKGGNIFAVGDDDQAIYGFRGAKLENILGFTEHFGVKSPVSLIENYRSGQTILDASYRMITHNNPERLEVRLGIDKRLRAQRPGQAVVFQPFRDARAEAKGVAAMLADRIAAGATPDTLAVLAPSHATLKSLARELRNRSVAYHLSSRVNIFEQPEITQLWHLLRWVGLLANDEAIMHVLLGPFIGWDDKLVRQLVDKSREQLSGIEEALVATATPAAEVVAAKLQQWRLWSRTLPISQLTYRLIFETGVSDAWIRAAEDSPRIVRVFEDLQVFMQHMQQFESVALEPTLAGYLQTFPRPPEVESDEMLGDEQGVSLLTIHASKGLEYATVIIMNNTHDAWSDRAGGRGAELPTGLERDPALLPPEHERRRLLYVAMTRAKDELILTAPLQQAGGRNRKPSPLLGEVFESLPGLSNDELAETSDLAKTLHRLQQYSPLLIQAGIAPLPFESSDGWLTLSTSDLDSYNYCPYEFYLEKVLQIRLPIGPQASFGSLLHSLFHDYYQSRLDGEPLALADLEARLVASWTTRGYETAEQAELARTVARDTLRRFFEREEASERKLRSTEEAFVLSLDEAKLRIRGRIDASFLATDSIEVWDFKTGRQHDPEKLAEKAKDSLQLRTYALALEEITGRQANHVVLDYVVTGVEGHAELSPRIMANHRSKLAEIADKIRARKFEPRRDMYHNCQATKYWGDPEDDYEA